LGLLLILGFVVYRRRSRSHQRKSNDATRLSAFPKEIDLGTYPTSPAAKSYAVSSTIAGSPDVSSYRGSEVPDEFGHYHQTRFEVDGSNRAAELYAVRPPVEAASQNRYDVHAGYAPTEAGSVNVFEAPAGTYHPLHQQG
jgi:hypothetical protein